MHPSNIKKYFGGHQGYQKDDPPKFKSIKTFSSTL